jgi:FAD/FMN-containing dehydrogenase
LIHDDLLRVAKGEVLTDEWSRQVYSVDASHYEIRPAAIVCPKDEHDVQEVCRYASAKGIPITARGAGTGLLGQSLTKDGIVLDFTKSMNQILELADTHVLVQPGMVKTVLDKELKKRGKFLPPDPASSNYCTIGGMVANNSSGVHCLGYGNTIDFIEQVNVVYADGSTKSDERFSKLCSLLSSNMDLIKKSYPKVSKNSCGYRLDAAMDNPHKVFVASEGTLGLVTSARFHIVDIPAYRSILVLGFEDLLSAIVSTPAILQFAPVALELLDSTVVDSRPDKQGCILLVEFAGSTLKQVEDAMNGCRQALASRSRVLEYASDEQSMSRIWAARKSALNRIMKLTVGSRRPIGLIEDTVVRPGLLAGHTASLLQEYRQNKLDYVLYGHVGDGNLHTRPLIDTGSKAEMELIERLARRIFEQVIKSGGTITGEHGDGLVRLGYIEMMYGAKVAGLFRQVKELFDPNYILNPGKKVPVTKQ